MERSEILALMGELRLFGMRAAFDEIITTAVKRQHEPQRIVAGLLQAEINEKHARSIRYRLGIAKLPLAKDIEEFQFTATPINETLIRDLTGRDAPLNNCVVSILSSLMNSATRRLPSPGGSCCSTWSAVSMSRPR